MKVIDIAPSEFIGLSEPRPLLIDVRTKWEYLTGSAPNASNLSLPKLLMGNQRRWRHWFLPQWFRELPKDQPIAVICLTAHRSPIAAQSLVKQGFTNVFNITGGMLEWRRVGLETVKTRK